MLSVVMFALGFVSGFAAGVVMCILISRGNP